MADFEPITLLKDLPQDEQDEIRAERAGRESSGGGLSRTGVLDNVEFMQQVRSGEATKPTAVERNSDFQGQGILSWDEAKQVTRGGSAFSDAGSILNKRREAYISNGLIAPFDARERKPLLPGLTEAVDRRSQDVIDFVASLEEEGFYNPVTGTGGEIIPDAKFYTQIDLISSMASGVAIDHRLAAEANIALWEENQAEVEAALNNYNVSYYRLEQSRAFSDFTAFHADDVPQVVFDGITTYFDRNIDEEGIATSLAMLSEDIKLGKREGESDKMYHNRLLTNFVGYSHSNTMAFMQKTGQIEAPVGPGWWESVVQGADNLGQGLADFLYPEERFGWEWGGDVGQIGEGFGQILSPVMNVWGVRHAAGAFGNIAQGLKPYFHDPIENAIRFYAVDVEKDPFREYLSSGQVLALRAGQEWGTEQFKTYSGLFDGVMEIATDPFTYVIPGMKALQVRRLAPLADALTDMSKLQRFAVGLTGKKIQTKMFGAPLPKNWKGPKGRLTSAFVFAAQKPIGEMLQSSRTWGKMIDRGYEAALAGKGMDKFLDSYPFLKEAQGLIGAIEEMVPIIVERGGDGRAYVLNAIQDGFAGLPVGDTKHMANTVRAVANNVQEKEAVVSNLLDDALRQGRLSPRDIGDHVRRYGNKVYDGILAFQVSNTGVARLVPLLEDGAKVTVFTTDMKLAKLDDVFKMVGNKSRTPQVFETIADLLGEGRRNDALTILDGMTDGMKSRIDDYLNAHGFDGFDIGANRQYLTQRVRARGIDTVDARVRGNLSTVIGEAERSLLESRRTLMDLKAGTDNLTWVVETPFRSVSASAMHRGYRAFTDNFLTQRGRRRAAAMGVRAQGFPEGVDWTDLNKAANAVEMIGHRLGFKADDVAEFVNRVRKAPTAAARRDELAAIRHEMALRVGDDKSAHLMQYINDERAFLGPKNTQGKSIAQGKSRTTNDVVDKAIEPHHMNNQVLFFPEHFYTELGRLQRAQKARVLPVKGWFDRGRFKTKSNRAALADRYEEMMRAKAPNVADQMTQRDYYNMAYATVRDTAVGIDDKLNGLGAASRASQYVGDWMRLAHSTFSVLTLTLRAPGWAGKVALFEEPIRGQLSSATKWYTNPVGSIRSTIQAVHLKGVMSEARMIPEVLAQMRSAVRTQIGNLDSLDDARRVANGLGLTSRAIDDAEDLVGLAKAVDRAVAAQLNAFNPRLNGRISFSEQAESMVKKIEVLRDGKIRGLDEVGEFGMTLDDVMSLGHGKDILGEGIEIYQNSLFSQMSGRLDTTRGYVTRNLSDDGIRQYSVAKGTRAVTEAGDEFHRFAIEYHIATLRGKAKPSMTELTHSSRWQHLRDNIADVADQRGAKWRTEEELAEWYVKNVQGELIEARWGGLWKEFDVDQLDVLDGVLDKNIRVEDINIPLTPAHESGAVAAYQDLMVKGRDRGSIMDTWEAEVYGDIKVGRWGANAPDWSTVTLAQRLQRKVFENTRLVGRLDPETGRMGKGVLQYFGAGVSEDVSRLPGWRGLYSNWRRTFDDLGWDAARADAGARMRATETINNIFYNSNDMPAILQKYNQTVPFGAAAYEVAKTWMVDMPKWMVGGNGITGWLAGGFALGRRWDYIVNALESTGLVQMKWNEHEERWERRFVLDDDSDMLASRLGFGLYSSIPTFTREVLGAFNDADFDGYERFEFNLGSPFEWPFSEQEGGLFTFSNQFGVGFQPILAYAVNKGMDSALGQRILPPSVFGGTRNVEWEGGTVTSFLDAHGITMEDFLAVPENRARLREAGFPLEDVTTIMRVLRENPEEIESLEMAAALGNIENFVLPEGKFGVEVAGASLGFVQDYIFPFGAPESVGEIIGDFLPSNVQNALMGIEALARDGEISGSNFFFGPTAAYRYNSAAALGLVVNMVADGTIGEMMNTVNKAAELRLKAVENGWANFDGDKGERFSWETGAVDNIDEAAAIERELASLGTDIKNFQAAVAMDSVDYAAGHLLAQGLLQTWTPISPRIFTKVQEDQESFWLSRTFAEGIKKGHGDAAYTRWIANLSSGDRINNALDVVREFLAPVQWDPAADDRTKAFYESMPYSTDVGRALRNNPQWANLWLYMQPNKVYPNGYVPLEGIEEWAESVQNGDREFTDPAAFVMRAIRAEAGYEADVDKAAFWENAEDFTYGLDNYEEFQLLRETSVNVFDYLTLVDEEIFEGALRKQTEAAKEIREGKPDVKETIIEQVNADLQRQESMLFALLDDIESMAITPEEASELTGAIRTLIDQVQSAEVFQADLREFGRLHPFEDQLNTYRSLVVAPYYKELGEIYAKLDTAETSSQTSAIYAEAQAFESAQFGITHNVDDIVVPSASAWNLERMVKDAEVNGIDDSKLEQRALRNLGGKVEWMSMYEVATVLEYARLSGGNEDNAKAALPQTASDWLPFNIMADELREIERQRLAGEIDNKEANALEKAWKEVLLENVSADTAFYLEATPAQRLDLLGVLPKVLYPAFDTAVVYVEHVQALEAAKIRHNKKDLWLQETWPLIMQDLERTPGGIDALRNMGELLFKETDLMQIGYQFFLGKFGDI